MSPTSDLDEGEGWSGGERLHLVLHLVLDVLLHALLLIDVLLLLHVEEDSGRHADGNGILRLWLHRRWKITHLTFNLCTSAQASG